MDRIAAGNGSAFEGDMVSSSWQPRSEVAGNDVDMIEKVHPIYGEMEVEPAME